MGQATRGRAFPAPPKIVDFWFFVRRLVRCAAARLALAGLGAGKEGVVRDWRRQRRRRMAAERRLVGWRHPPHGGYIGLTAPMEAPGRDKPAPKSKLPQAAGRRILSKTQAS